MASANRTGWRMLRAQYSRPKIRGCGWLARHGRQYLNLRRVRFQSVQRARHLARVLVHLRRMKRIVDQQLTSKHTAGRKIANISFEERGVARQHHRARAIHKRRSRPYLPPKRSAALRRRPTCQWPPCVRVRWLAASSGRDETRLALRPPVPTRPQRKLPRLRPRCVRRPRPAARPHDRKSAVSAT